MHPAAGYKSFWPPRWLYCELCLFLTDFEKREGLKSTTYMFIYLIFYVITTPIINYFDSFFLFDRS